VRATNGIGENMTGSIANVIIIVGEPMRVANYGTAICSGHGEWQVDGGGTAPAHGCRQ